MGAQSTVLTWDLLRSLAATSFTGSYVAVGTPLTVRPRIIRFVNNTNQSVTISIDGVNDYDALPNGMAVTYEIGTNRGNPSPESVIQQGTQFYVKGAVGTGTFYIVDLYAQDASPAITGL